MIKHTRFLRVCTDKTVITSSKAPEPLDEWDGTCPACGSSEYHEKLTIVQHGFQDDDCLSIIACERCHEAFHYYYQVQAAALDEVIATTAFRPPAKPV